MTEQSTESPALNPWWGIWVQPRQAIRMILETDSRMNYWVLVIFYGVIRAVSWGILAGLGDQYSPSEVAGFIAIAGPMLGIAGVYFTGAVLGLVGRLLGGNAEGKQIRTVLAWAALPMNVLVILALFPSLMIFGQKIFSLEDPLVQRAMYGDGTLAGLFTGGLSMWRMMLEGIGSLYYIVIVVIGLSEVEDFSVWKSAGIIFIVVGGLLLFSLCLALVGSLV